MHVIIVNYVYNPKLRTPHELLDSFFGLKGWVDGLSASGAEVTVFQRFREDHYLKVKDAEYQFVSDNFDPRLRTFQIPFRFNSMVSKYIKNFLSNRSDIIIHVNGLIFPLQLFHLRISIKDCAIVLQNHAERPGNRFKGRLQKVFLRFADGFIFSTREHARDWKNAGIIKDDHIVGEVMEISSILKYESRDVARERTGMHGNPIIIWTGNLNQNKDPFTILHGLEMILEEAPGSRMYMAYRYDDLLIELRNYIESSQKLKGVVTLMGAIPYKEIEPFYNSADFFVQGSHHEGSGIALLDAIACGVVPVVTDIPSFRVITDNGRIGALWAPGNSREFADAFLSLLQYPLERLSAEARTQFKNHYNFEALGSNAVEYYRRVIRKKSRS